MNKTKVLVTGGSGYIGSHTILELIRTSRYEVISIDNFVNSASDVYDKIQTITGEKIRYYQTDLCDLENTRKVFKENPDIQGVIHFAALKSVPESVANPVSYYKNNLESLLNILTCCEEYGIKKIIFSSSCSVYGNVMTLPVDENTPLSQVESPYAHTKLIGEQILKTIATSGRIQALILRYFNPVGADKTGLLGESPKSQINNLVPIITRTAIGLSPVLKVFGDNYNTRDGSCVRDYIHVSDIADAHVKALEYVEKVENDFTFDIFNLGTGNGITVLEAIHAFEKISGINLKYEIVDRRMGDVASIYSNSSKANKILNWIPQYDIDEMMRTAWEWQKTLDN